MKQAFTNTIRGGGGRPLTIATGKKSKGKNKQQLPMCAYGAACTRKGCAYRHPSKQQETYDNYYDDPKSKICKPFLAGLCTFGRKCMCRHPEKEEADAVRASYKAKLCSHGDDCMTEGCLYFHPWEGKEENLSNEGDLNDVNTEFTEQELEELCAEVGEIDIQNKTNSTTTGTSTRFITQNQIPTYDQWMSMNCPPPITMDPNEAYNLWYFPGSAMQRNPYEVYTLMYPEALQQQQQQQQQATTNLNATTQSWQPTPTGICQFVPPQSYESNNTNNYEQQQQNEYYNEQQQPEEPTTFEQWKAMGCPYPSWFYSEYDPWYDDENIRRSMHDVYELLFGSRVDEMVKRQEQEQIEAFPTPAEQLATEISTGDSTTVTTATTAATNPATAMANTTTSTGGWASIAAKQAAPTPTTTFTQSTSTEYHNTTTQTKNKSSNKNKNSNKQKMVPIPKEVWLPDTANANFFHMYPDPIDRFHAVNDFHKPYLASVTIPLCFHIDNEENDNHDRPNTSSTSSSKVTLLDVHFQSAKTITTVLNHFLPTSVQQNQEVWIITGSGHHVAKGSHQKRESGGVLFHAVKKYLEEYDIENNEYYYGGDDSASYYGIEFRVGKDTSSGRNKISGGAFLVRKKRV